MSCETCGQPECIGRGGVSKAEKVKVVHPVPPGVMRQAEVSELPRTALSLAKLADENGWAVTATYAEGFQPVRGKEPRPVTSVAVRMAKPNARLAAIWTDGKFTSGLAPFKRYTLAQLKEEVQK